MKVKVTPFFFFLRLLAWCLVGFGLYLFVAWTSYHPFDMGYSTANLNDQVQNVTGSLGALLTDVSFTFFGQIANLIPFVFCAAPILWLIYAKSAPTSIWVPLRWLAGIVLLLCGFTSLATFTPVSANFSDFYTSGGVLGEWLKAEALKYGLNDLVFFVLIALALVGGFLLCKGLEFCQIAHKVYRWALMKPQEEDKDEEVDEFEHDEEENVAQNNLSENNDAPIFDENYAINEVTDEETALEKAEERAVAHNHTDFIPEPVTHTVPKIRGLAPHEDNTLDSENSLSHSNSSVDELTKHLQEESLSKATVIGEEINELLQPENMSVSQHTVSDHPTQIHTETAQSETAEPMEIQDIPPIDLAEIGQPIDVKVSDEVMPKKVVAGEIQEIPVVKMAQKENPINPPKTRTFNTATLSPEALQAQIAMRQRVQAQRVLAKFGRLPSQNPVAQEPEMKTEAVADVPHVDHNIHNQTIAEPVPRQPISPSTVNASPKVENVAQEFIPTPSATPLHIQLNDIPEVAELAREADKVALESNTTEASKIIPPASMANELAQRQNAFAQAQAQAQAQNVHISHEQQDTQPTQNAYTPREAQVAQPPQNAYTPREAQVAQPTQNASTPREAQVAQPTQNAYTPREAQVAQPTQNAYTSREAQVAQPTQNAYTPREAQVAQPTQDAYTPREAQVAQPTQNAYAPREAQVAQPTQNASTPREAQVAQLTQNAFTPREAQVAQPTQNAYTSREAQVAQPTQNAYSTQEARTNNQPVVEEVEAEDVSNIPQYQVYGDSLIHPALQKRMEVLEKPTTPLPTIDLLDKHPSAAQNITEASLQQTSARIEHLLKDFGVKATVEEVLVGPVVTRYELALQPGVKASKITNIESDLARALLFPAIRVAEVIPGKPYIGIETPNAERQTVFLRDVLDSDEFREAKSPLSMALGKDISGEPVVVDLASMPHLLVAGATGSGKSVGVNTMILSLLFRVKPEDVKFIMIDPKVVELSVYNGIPHLLTEVVTDMKKASNALRWCVDEMERRYQLLAALSVRNIEGYNEQIEKYEKLGMPIPNPLWKPGDTMDKMPPPLEKLPYIVVIVDEFADLMMMVGKQVEELIARLAQKARAIGIHLILATQRPSVDVITGLIKANIPTRIAFSVASKIDSRTILDQGGAEALLGRGDMLYAGKNALELTRVHGAYMTDEEVVRVANDWRARGKPNYIDGILDYADEEEESAVHSREDMGDLDELFDEVVDFVVNTGTTSVSALQRRFRIGFNRAARIMDQLEEQGIVSSMQNGKREVLARSTDY